MGRTMTTLRPVAGETHDVTTALQRWLDADEPEPIQVATSGSSGTPKVVELPRAAVLASVGATAKYLGGQGRWALAVPPSYIAGVQVIVRSLVAGHDPAVVGNNLADGLAAAPDVDYISVVPTQLRRALDDPRATEQLQRLHAVLVGGGPVDPRLRERAAADDITVVATYGGTETAGGCVYDGVPLDGVGLDFEKDGRIRISGPMLASGYVDGTGPNEDFDRGWFRTSDVGELGPDGRLRVLGRIDDMVLSGGLKIPAPVVAARLLEHPDVHQVEVLGVSDPEWGQRLVAYVVGTLTGDHARDWIAESHPRAWAPRTVIELDELPTLSNGKIDRQALRDMA